MPVVKIRTNRQVTIPKTIFETLGLREGDFIEVTLKKDQILLEPKRLMDFADTLTPEEERVVEQGFKQLKRGDYVTWEALKHELHL
jgi:AbrB family looped-hinge helix DNA binding protein